MSSFSGGNRSTACSPLSPVDLFGGKTPDRVTSHRPPALSCTSFSSPPTAMELSPFLPSFLSFFKYRQEITQLCKMHIVKHCDAGLHTSPHQIALSCPKLTASSLFIPATNPSSRKWFCIVFVEITTNKTLPQMRFRGHELIWKQLPIIWRILWKWRI